LCITYHRYLLTLQRNPDLYPVASSSQQPQPNDGLIDLQQQHTQQSSQHSSSILHPHLQQQPPNMAAFHLQQHPSQHQNTPAPFEEYETPPRLRRGMLQQHQSQVGGGAGIMGGSPMSHRSSPQRHLNHRQPLNGRGIMGQGPKPIRPDHIRLSNTYS